MRTSSRFYVFRYSISGKDVLITPTVTVFLVGKASIPSESWSMITSAHKKHVHFDNGKKSYDHTSTSCLCFVLENFQHVGQGITILFIAIYILWTAHIFSIWLTIANTSPCILSLNHLAKLIKYFLGRTGYLPILQIPVSSFTASQLSHRAHSSWVTSAFIWAELWVSSQPPAEGVTMVTHSLWVGQQF